MKIQSISKLFLLVLIMFLTVFLGSCSDKDFRIKYYYSKEEKQVFVECFKEYNERENSNYIKLKLDYPVKEGKEGVVVLGTYKKIENIIVEKEVQITEEMKEFYDLNGLKYYTK